jgi:hypothetical protein
LLMSSEKAMDENPYKAPQEKPADRSGRLIPWRVIAIALIAFLVISFLYALLFPGPPRGAGTRMPSESSWSD